MEPAGNELIREIAKALFEMELVKDNSAQTGRKLALSPVTNQFLDTVSLVLIQKHGGNHDNARRLIANIIQDLHDRGQGDNKERVRNTSHLLGAIVGKFVSLCWNPDWRHKVAGCAGFSVLVSDEVNLGAGWPYTKEIEFCRSLIMALKDMPPDPPAEVPEITATILKIMRFCNPPQLGDQMQTEGESLDENARKEMTTEEIQHYEWTNKPVVKKAELYLNIFSVDLTSSNKTVRDTIQAILGLIAELAGVSLSEFLKPAIPKLTTNIFLKPLRMFTPIVQIGFMDAMTYLLNIDPPVLEANDAFWRLMNEVIVLGELEDPYPAMPKMNRRATMLTAKTKAAAIRLITASLVIADYFSAQKTARQRYVLLSWSQRCTETS
jgi:transformation/transcription domain-associated protein